MIKGYKLRLYPTKEQEALMWMHINQCRFIWNYMLAKQEELYKNGEKHMSAYDMSNVLTLLKNDGEHGWLYDCSNRSYQIVCADLDKAYKSFFARVSKCPKFKSKKMSKSSYPVRCDTVYLYNNNRVNIEKVGKVKFKTDLIDEISFGGKISNARVSYKNGKWMLSFGMERENQMLIEKTDKAMGIDVGVKDTMIVAYGEEKIVFPNINKSKEIRTLKVKIKHLQRTISRKYEANKQGNGFVKTQNIVRCEDALRKLYARLSNIRSNYIHQCTSKCISLRPYKVVMEDLNIAGMMKNRYLSKAIQEQCFYEIARQMQYKCEWNGIEFIKANRFYPSSKTCSNCGCIHSGLKLSDRTFVCPECGFTIDRDYQAALNLMRYEA